MTVWTLALSSIILSVSIVRESNDELEVAVDYVLSGETREVFVSAITLYDGFSTGHWSYRPAMLTPGRNRAIVTVFMNPDGPARYWSDALLIRVYGGAREELEHPHRKLWCHEPGPCRDDELQELRVAPLSKRLTSVQPSIREPALKEALLLDDEGKRQLFPGILDDLRYAEPPVRFKALDALERLAVSDVALTPTLVEAIRDPHPGVSRVATSLLAKLALPHDTLAEQALHEASTSTDESTRGYAESGLKRLKRSRELANKPSLGYPVPDTEAGCAARDGQWGRFGLYVVSECNLPTPDAGTPCQDGVECVSACTTDVGSTEPTRGFGACHPWTILRGTCLNYVERGMIQPKLCVD